MLSPLTCTVLRYRLLFAGVEGDTEDEYPLTLTCCMCWRVRVQVDQDKGAFLFVALRLPSAPGKACLTMELLGDARRPFHSCKSP